MLVGMTKPQIRRSTAAKLATNRFGTVCNFLLQSKLAQNDKRNTHSNGHFILSQPKPFVYTLPGLPCLLRAAEFRC